jgi:hypothetical protein
MPRKEVLLNMDSGKVLTMNARIFIPLGVALKLVASGAPVHLLDGCNQVTDLLGCHISDLWSNAAITVKCIGWIVLQVVLVIISRSILKVIVLVIVLVVILIVVSWSTVWYVVWLIVSVNVVRISALYVIWVTIRHIVVRPVLRLHSCQYCQNKNCLVHLRLLFFFKILESG